MTTEQKLDTLATLRAKKTSIDLETANEVEAIKAKYYPDELLIKIAEAEQAAREEVDALYSQKEQETKELASQIADLEEQVKLEVITKGSSVKGQYLQAVFAKGRVTWDNKGLDGFMVAHPEISAFRKVGSPTVSFREVK